MEGEAVGKIDRSGWRSLREALEMIKVSHTVFALPFALLAAFRAAGGMIPGRTLLWILVAMVGARTAAMTFNRIIDRKIDAKNPRTAARALPAGRLSVRFAALLCAGSSVLFIVAAGELNRLALALSVPVLALLFFYSATKRWTSLSHLVLGLCLGIAPVGAWIAVRGKVELPPILLCLAVLTWVAGFDIIYALQDADFDRHEGLFSLPVLAGSRGALRISAFLHLLTLVFLFCFLRAVSGGPLFVGAVVLAALALAYQHSIVRPGDLSRVGAAFFTANGFVSLAVGTLGIADLWIRFR